jgi:hypothetical protein
VGTRVRQERLLPNVRCLEHCVGGKSMLRAEPRESLIPSRQPKPSPADCGYATPRRVKDSGRIFVFMPPAHRFRVERTAQASQSTIERHPTDATHSLARQTAGCRISRCISLLVAAVAMSAGIDAQALDFRFSFGSEVPTAMRQATLDAGALWASRIVDPVTLDITIHAGVMQPAQPGHTLLGSTQGRTVNLDYAVFRAALVADQRSANLGAWATHRPTTSNKCWRKSSPSSYPCSPWWASSSSARTAVRLTGQV